MYFFLTCHILSWFKGSSKLPPASEMTSCVQTRQEIIEKQYPGRKYPVTPVQWIEYMDTIAELIGCKPDIGM